MPISLHKFSTEPIGPKPCPQRLRRVSRLRETEDHAVRKAIPNGSTRASHGKYVHRALTEHPEYQRCYAPRRQKLSTVLQLLIARADYDTMTTRPTWAYLCEQTGISRRTIARVLVTLRAWGLLGIVASGRAAKYASMDENGERHNEAAVYVLCTPSQLHIVKEPSPTDSGENGTPPAVGGSRVINLKIPPHARKENPGGAASPPESESPGFAGPAPLPTNRPNLLWPAHRTAASKKERLAAASELRRRAFLLRPMSPKDVRSAIRDFLVCGWTVSDLNHALDFQPNGQRWPHDGVPQDANAPRLRGWLAYRLNAWRTTAGEPLRSRDQRLANEAAENRAAAVKATEAAKQTMEAKAQETAQDSPAKIVALDSIRTMLRESKRRRNQLPDSY